MPRVAVARSVTLSLTARAMQLRGMFDLPAVKLGAVTFDFDAPLEDRPWQVGLILGPSGAGKSTVAEHLFGADVLPGYDWPADAALVDGFDLALSLEVVTNTLRAVGFDNPAAWLRPFAVLSQGEQFRATLARALVDVRPRVVLDEFTSVVDRATARVGSQAVAAAVRAVPGKQFVAVACHDDLLPWLRPDWIIEPHAGRFTWAPPGDVPALHSTVFEPLLMRQRGALSIEF